MTVTFGINILVNQSGDGSFPDLVDVYRGGVREARFKHVARTTNPGAVLVFGAFGSASDLGVHVDALNVKTSVGGSSVFTDDFTVYPGSGGWTDGYHGGNWAGSPSPASHAYCSEGDPGSWQRATPGSTPLYFEMTGVYFDGDGVPDGWVMIAPYRANPTVRIDGSNVGGYRVLLRPNGSIEVPDGVSVPLPATTDRPKLRGGQVIYGELRGGQRWV